MTSWGVVRRRIRRPRISKRNGKRRVSRRICTPVLRGKEASSQRNLLLPSRLLLPNQRYPLLQYQRASPACLQPLRLLLLTPHRLLPQSWRLSLQTNRTSPLQPALFMNASAAIADSPLGRSTNCFKCASLPRGLGSGACLAHSYKGAGPLVESPRRGHTPFGTPRRGITPPRGSARLSRLAIARFRDEPS